MSFIPKMIVGLLLLMSYSPGASAQVSLELPPLEPTTEASPWYMELQTAYLFENDYFSDFDGFGSIILGLGKNQGKTLTGINLELQSYQTGVVFPIVQTNRSFPSYNREVIGANLSLTHAYRFLNISLLRVYGGPTAVLGATSQDIEPIIADKFPIQLVDISLGLGGKLMTYWHLSDAWAINAGIRLILIDMTWDTQEVENPALTRAQSLNAGFSFEIFRPEFYAPLGITYFFGA